MKQQGFSLVSALLALVISASALAMIVPALMRWGERVSETRQLIFTVDDVFSSMEIAAREHWSVTGCQNTTPAISLNSLVQHFELPVEVSNLPWQFVPSYRTPWQFVVSITTPTLTTQNRIISAFTSTHYLTEVSGNTVNIILNNAVIESQYQLVNFNAQSQCYEQ
ncbi:type II secretion system protein [Shewanella colwelliana]|uniref:type II secretion system protein n=1 Tax=Shewanella colwelliana TaxID=23 RepID=UPI0037359427